MKLKPQTTAFVFPGQGSQAVGMGKDLAEKYPVAKETFDEADSILGFSLSQLMWNGPEMNSMRRSIRSPRYMSIRLPRGGRSRISTRIQACHRCRAFPWRIIGSDRLWRVIFFRWAQTRPYARRIDEARPENSTRVAWLPSWAWIFPRWIKSVQRQVQRMKSSRSRTIIVPGQVVISGNKPALERAMAGAKAAGAKRAIALPGEHRRTFSVDGFHPGGMERRCGCLCNGNTAYRRGWKRACQANAVRR